MPSPISDSPSDSAADPRPELPNLEVPASGHPTETAYSGVAPEAEPVASPSAAADQSPEAQPVSHPGSQPAPNRGAPRDSRWRPFLCCAGALGVGLSLAPLLLKPAAVRNADAGTSAPEIALRTEDTLLVSPAMPPGALLRGRVRLVAGDTDAIGRARAGGQVARQLVATGTRVERGDAVMEISSGASVRVAPVSERRQNRAEQRQIDATDAQSALVQKINLAQTRLIAAQERVARAQTQTATARDVVRRLQNGQSVSGSAIPAPFRGAGSSPAPTPGKRSRRSDSRRSRHADSRLSAAAQIASRQADAAREAAQESQKALQTARDTLGDAQSAARLADEKRESAAKAVASVEARFDAEKASGAEVETARAAQREAQTAVDTADQALIFAKTEVGKREKNAAAAQSYARSSAEQAAKSLADTRSAAPGSGTDADATSNNGADAEAPTASGTATTSAGAGRVTLDQAIRFASAALDESRRASREAERIHDEIAGYQSQVTQSHSRIEAASQGLVQAQQGVMESVPRPRFTSCYAPSSGIITWISRLAREVSEGDAVFGIARQQRAAARFEDKSGLWRAIKPGAILSAFVVDAPPLSDPPSASQAAGARAKAGSGSGADVTSPAESGGATAGEIPGSVATAGNLAPLGAGHEIQLKMAGVQAPATPGEAAHLTGVPLGAAGSQSALSEGAQILVSMPLPHQKATLSVPTSALIERGGATYLAVLVPLSPAEIAARAAAQPPARSVSPATDNASGEGASGAGAAPGATPAAPAGEAFRLRWSRVQTGRSDGMRLEIRSGVASGARVVSQPEDLEAMGFAPPLTTKPTIFDKKNATPSAQATSNPAPTPTGASVEGVNEAVSPASAPEPEVLVRLTPASG